MNLPQIPSPKDCKNLWAYLAPQGFEKELKRELKGVCFEWNNLFLAQADQTPIWLQNAWKKINLLEAPSIGGGAKNLKTLQTLWANLDFHLHRRSQLIQEQLPKLKIPTLEFLGPLPQKNVGAWSLLDENSILALTEPTHLLPMGEVHFQEDKVGPPSRAYLKLWELFTLYDLKPQAGEKCLDLGSAPGGWSWVLSEMNAQVISVDKAPLEPKLDQRKNIEFIKSSAFALEPKDMGSIDWFFSDIICYPKKLLQLVEKWEKSNRVKNFVCTIKFQGETDFELIQDFKEKSNSKLIHLFNNKHELTWIRAE